MGRGCKVADFLLRSLFVARDPLDRKTDRIRLIAEFIKRSEVDHDLVEARVRHGLRSLLGKQRSPQTSRIGNLPVPVEEGDDFRVEVEFVLLGCRRIEAGDTATL